MAASKQRPIWASTRNQRWVAPSFAPLNSVRSGQTPATKDGWPRVSAPSLAKDGWPRVLDLVRGGGADENQRLGAMIGVRCGGGEGQAPDLRRISRNKPAVEASKPRFSPNRGAGLLRLELGKMPTVTVGCNGTWCDGKVIGQFILGCGRTLVCVSCDVVLTCSTGC
jgi:hypothetical protein